MNKLICILALLVLVFCFASCKNKNEGAENVDDESQNENKNDETVEEKPSEDIVATPTEGILYDISNDGSYAMVTGYDGAEKNVIIADIFEGLPVTKICSYAFCGSEISSITISDNITHIEGYAFTNCDSLTSLTIGKSVNYIGAYAFHQCIALEQFYFNAAVLDDFICSNNSFYEIGINGNGIKVVIGKNVTRFPSALFSNYAIQSQITSIIFEESGICKSIEKAAFYCYENLISIIIPNSVTTIGDFAFAGCTSLTSIIIPDSVTTIGDLAFEGCTSLTSIIIPDSVTTIGNEAFSECSGLENVILGNGLNYLGENLFFGCTSLVNLTIGKNINALDIVVFNDCKRLESINVDKSNTTYKSIDGNLYSYAGETLILYAKAKPETSFTVSNTVTNIGNYAFYGCTNLTDIIFSKNVTNIGEYAFFGTSLNSLTISENITKIGDYAFSNCYSLKEIHFKTNKLNDFSNFPNIFITSEPTENRMKVIFGKNITHIPAKLFSGCRTLSYIEFEDGSLCQSIGSYAFNSCPNLISVKIPETVSSIGDNAFRYCNKLSTISIPKSVSSIGEQAFLSCNSLKEIYFNAVALDDLTYYSKIFKDAGKDHNELKVIFGKDVSKIPNSLFYGCEALKSVEFEEGGNSITIGSSSFADCTGLTILTISNNVTVIGKSAFGSCQNLLSVTFGNGVSEIGERAFDECTSLTSIIIPDNVKTIGSWAFYNCTALTSATIGDGVTKIGSYAFANCSSLKSLVIGKKVTNISNNVFSECKMLDEIYFNAISMTDGHTGLKAFYNAGIDGDGIRLTIGKDVTRIPLYLFQESSFSSTASKIISVEFEDGSACRSINEEAFYGFSYLQNVIIGDGVTEIGVRAFAACRSLTSVKIGNSVVSIQHSAFYDCKNLTNIIWGSSLTNIGERAFEDCKSLTSLIIPDSVTSIGGWAFAGCDNLFSITIGKNVKSIEQLAFAGCGVVEEIYFNAKAMNDLNSSNLIFNGTGTKGNGIRVVIGKEVLKIPSYLFYFTSYDYLIILPKIASLEFEEGSHCLYIGRASFMECTLLTTVIIPEKVTAIDDYAFKDCSGLKEFIFNATNMDDIGSGNVIFQNAGIAGFKVTIGKNVIQIPANLFASATNITKVTFEEGSVCKTIGDNAFKECKYINSITIPEGVTILGNGVFFGCIELTNVVIPVSVTTIGDKAFERCYYLTNIKYRGTSSQWNMISKGARWDKDTDVYNGAYTITYSYTED